MIPPPQAMKNNEKLYEIQETLGSYNGLP